MNGAIYDNGRCRFSVWAPRASKVALHIVEHDGGLGGRVIPMGRSADDTFSVTVEGAGPGTLYFYRLDDIIDRPDPASRHQPLGVHGPSAVVDARFPWTDQAHRSPALGDLVLYELHVGTFSPEGTFDGVVAHLDRLRELGVNAVEIMPVAQFPGGRNWGYDGVYPYAVQGSYGGLAGFQRLVDACHARGMAVILDVVYNHLGPEGNYLNDYGPYFTDHYKTPWGAALNFDGEDSDHVRRFFIDSALFFIDACHVDGFRLDAIHAIIDASARPFLQELTHAIHECARSRGLPGVVIGESDLNDVRVLLEPGLGGLGMDAHWTDDFHHSVHTLVTGERSGYYQDYGALEQLARACTEAYVYTGQYSPFRRRRHGNSPGWCSGERFVVYSQNHDQIGNRAQGDRLSALVTLEQQKLLACLLLLGPYVPLLFMGQEYGEIAPFLYFTSHTDPHLAEAVRHGRRSEFAFFIGGDPSKVPDPQDEQTFVRSRLDWSCLQREPHASLWQLHRSLIELRRRLPALRSHARDRSRATAYEREQVIVMHRASEQGDVVVVFDLRPSGEQQPFAVPLGPGSWQKVLDTSERDAAFIAGDGESAEIFESQGVHLVTLAASSCLAFATEPP